MRLPSSPRSQTGYRLSTAVFTCLRLQFSSVLFYLVFDLSSGLCTPTFCICFLGIISEVSRVVSLYRVKGSSPGFSIITGTTSSLHLKNISGVVRALSPFNRPFVQNTAANAIGGRFRYGMDARNHC